MIFKIEAELYTLNFKIRKDRISFEKIYLINDYKTY